MSDKVGKRIFRWMLVPCEWIGIVLVLPLIVVLPRRGLFALADLLSAAYYLCDRRGRNRALENLHILRGRTTGAEGTKAFDPRHAAYRPTPREARVIRRAYRNMTRSVGYAFWTCVFARKRAAATGEVCARTRAFLSAHRPAVTVSAHLGCWEILSQLAFLEGHQMMSVAKDIGTRGMTHLLVRARTAIGQEIVPAAGAFKPLMNGLKCGKSLGLLVDQKVSPRAGGVWVRFLGRPMPVSAAPAFFAAKAKVPIIVAWSRPLKDGRYRCEEIREYGRDEVRDIWKTTQSILLDLERVIRAHPSCWILNYNYFRATPRSDELDQLEAREREAAR